MLGKRTSSLIGQTLDRYEIIDELGRGGQGTVYLARDRKLDRPVALKTLRNKEQQAGQLAHEARIVSKLSHPNIIALYDSGEHKGLPYLVYAHIQGETLAQLLKREQHLSGTRAAEIASDLLEGLDYAHREQVLHLDIKPGNVMLSHRGPAMLMDFGLAAPTGSGDAATLDGTPRYIAPERIDGQPARPQSDLYAVGTLLYEMVTGTFAVGGESVFEVLNCAANANIAAPSQHDARIDPVLEQIILKAVARDPAARYPDAAAMRQALRDYLGGHGQNAQGNAGSTLEFLIRRMRSNSEFPALSATISEINQIVASESESAGKLARVILQDFALTNKLLKLVNAASYSRFGGNINTVSKAVVILGFETVRNIATSLILLEFMQNKAQAEQMRDEMVQSVFSGLVASQLAAGADIRDGEEVMVCAMFHNLGRMLATFYFFEESREIGRLVEQGSNEETASSHVLGLSYSELGLGVARNWNFPGRLLAGMRKLPPGEPQGLHDEEGRITAAVNLANELCELAGQHEAGAKPEVLAGLSARYGKVLQVPENRLSDAIDSGLGELAQRAAVLGFGVSRSHLHKRLQRWHRKEEATAAETPAASSVQELTRSLTELGAVATPDRRQHAPEAVLGSGIQDVTASLVGEYKLNDVLQMILETLYRGMHFRRAFFLLRDHKTNTMAARIGFGEDSDAILPRFRFTMPFQRDVFHLALEKGLDIAIEDVEAENIRDKIPGWFIDKVGAPCFMLLPVMVKDKAIALFYADMAEANALNLSQQQLSLLRTLRNQAVLAIRQKL